MFRTLIESRLQSSEHNPKSKQKPNNTKSIIPPNLHSFQQKLLSGNGIVEYKGFQI